jgi:hypothetical protein
MGGVWRRRMRLFLLIRNEDVSGVSGTGIVAEGVEFSDGTVAMRWLRRLFSVAFYGSIRDVLAIHGHGGRTQVKWLDYSDCIESLQRARQCAD